MLTGEAVHHIRNAVFVQLGLYSVPGSFLGVLIAHNKGLSAANGFEAFGHILNGAGFNAQVVHLHFMMMAASTFMTAFGDQSFKRGSGEINHVINQPLLQIHLYTYCIVKAKFCQ